MAGWSMRPMSRDDAARSTDDPGTAGGRPRLLFVSNLFPDQAEPVRGQDNAVLLGWLRQHYDIEVLALRPSLAWWRRPRWQPLERDLPLNPVYTAVPYVPKRGDRWNHRVMEWRLRPLLERRLREGGCQRLLASWLYPDGCAVSRWSATRNVPTCLIAQGSDVHQYLLRPARRRAIIRAVRDCGRVITRSEALRGMLTDAGADPDAVRCIYNGVDTGLFHPGDRAAARHQLDLPANRPVLLFVGNLLPVKNPHLTLQAVARLATDLPASRQPLLAIIGTGPMQAELEAAAADLDIAQRVRWLGRQPSERVATFMQAADLLLMSSRNEGLPNVILEAQACGLPVVSTDVGGIAELVPVPRAGRLTRQSTAELARAMLLVLDDVGVDRTWISNHGQQHDWAQSAAAYREWIETGTPDSPPVSNYG